MCVPLVFANLPPRLRQAPDLMYVRAYVLTNPQEVLTGNIPFEHLSLRLEPLVMRAIMNCRSPHQPDEPLLAAAEEVQLWALCRSCWHVDPKCRPTIMALQEQLREVCASAQAGGFSPGPPGPGQRTVVPTRQLQHLGHCTGRGDRDYGHSETPHRAGPSSLSRLVRGSPAGERTRTEATRLDLTSIVENNRNRPDLQKTDLRMPPGGLQSLGGSLSTRQGGTPPRATGKSRNGGPGRIMGLRDINQDLVSLLFAYMCFLVFLKS